MSVWWNDDATPQAWLAAWLLYRAKCLPKKTATSVQKCLCQMLFSSKGLVQDVGGFLSHVQGESREKFAAGFEAFEGQERFAALSQQSAGVHCTPFFQRQLHTCSYQVSRCLRLAVIQLLKKTVLFFARPLHIIISGFWFPNWGHDRTTRSLAKLLKLPSVSSLPCWEQFGIVAAACYVRDVRPWSFHALSSWPFNVTFLFALVQARDVFLEEGQRVETGTNELGWGRRFLQGNRRSAEAACFFTHKGSKDPAHTVQSPKSNEKGDCQKSAFVCNADWSQICNVCVPQGKGPNKPCLALIWRLFFVLSFWTAFRVPAFHAFEHL